jgi:NAD(P)H-hydrate repair Nnr-like enzyme with NAD(P)H-hydrate dehydratase domain
MLFDWIKKSEADVVITPHAGEFKRLFKFEDVEGKSKIDLAFQAAKLSGSP